MIRIPLLAMAMVFLPSQAMASSFPTVPRPRDLGPVAQVTPPCTPVNPCAVTSPAIGSVPPLPMPERHTGNRRAAPSASQEETQHAKL